MADNATTYRHSYIKMVFSLFLILATIVIICIFFKNYHIREFSFWALYPGFIVIVGFYLTIRQTQSIWANFHTRVTLHDDKLIYAHGNRIVKMRYNDIALIKTQSSLNRQIKDFYGNEIILYHGEICKLDELIDTLSARAQRAEIVSSTPQNSLDTLNRKKHRRGKYLRFCPGCRQEIYVDDRYANCPDCGREYPPPRFMLFKNRSLNESVMALLVLFVAIIIIFIVFKLYGAF